MIRVLALVALLSLGGCLIDDCSFDLEDLTYLGRLEADASAVGDTLTLAFVSSGDPELVASVRAGAEAETPATDDGTVRLVFDNRATVFEGDAPPLLAAETVGDTVYVYVQGRFDPALFLQTCSPPVAELDLLIREVAVPRGVRTVRTVRLGADAVSPAAAQALRQRDALRPTTV